MKINERIVTLKDKRKLILKSPEVKDAENLLLHIRRVFKESYRNMTHPADYFDKLTIEEEEKILARFIESDSKFMISSFLDNKIVGNIGITSFGTEFAKYSARLGMGVEANIQGNGVGNALVKYALAEAKSHHFHRIELSVRTFNYPAIALYEKHQFEKVGTLKEHAFIDGKFFDEFLYQKIL